MRVGEAAQQSSDRDHAKCYYLLSLMFLPISYVDNQVDIKDQEFPYLVPLGLSLVGAKALIARKLNRGDFHRESSETPVTFSDQEMSMETDD